MKVYRLQLLLALIFCYSGVSAQQKIYNNEIHILGLHCVQKTNQVVIDISMNAIKVSVPLRQSLVLTPVIKSKNNQKELPAIVISGANRYKSDQRAKNFNGQIMYDRPYTIVKEGSIESSMINYTYTVAFEPWMQTAWLEMKEEVYGCASCEKKQSSDSLMLVQLELTKPSGNPEPNYTRPRAEPIKNRYIEGRANLDFPSGQAVILPNYGNNARELSKILEAINMVRNDPYVIITSISICGFSSPEGNYATNERLSAQRSQALKNYLQEKYNYVYDDRMFNLSSVAEDWTGLKNLIASSNMADRRAVLAIIDDNSANYDEKEYKLKILRGNAVYTELMDDYFPQLRRVEYKLNYLVRAFSVEEGKEILKTKPSNLSLNEMFLIANTYPQGSEQFNQVYDIAARMYPKDTIANINAAALALEKNDTRTAHQYLDPYLSTPESFNNQGVLYFLEGDYNKAKDLFIKAKAQGIAEAEQNLILTQAWLDYSSMN